MRHFTLAAIAGAALAATLVYAQEPQVPGTSKPIPPSPPGQLTPEQVAMQNAAPAAPHAALAKLVGEWTTTTSFQPGPDSPPIQSSGSATLTMTLDGRFLQDNWKGDMMGAPASSSKTLGFNNGSGKYETVWTYTMSTGMLFGLGTTTDAGKTVVFQGTFDDGPNAGGPSSLFLTLKVTSDNEFSWEIADTAPGMERRGPVMTTTYKRKK